MKVNFTFILILLKSNKIYKDICISSSEVMHKKSNTYFRKKESCESKRIPLFNLEKKNFYNFDIEIKIKYIKYLIRKDYYKSIKVTEYCNTKFGPYYYSREVKKLSKKEIQKLKKELECVKSNNFEVIESFKGNCILSPNIVIQLIERLAYSLSELFMIDNVTFSCNSKKLFDNNITLIDVPLMFHGNYHRRYDDEMMRTKRKIIINKGYVADTFSGLNLGFSKYGNVYCDELNDDEKMTFSNLFLKVPKRINEKEGNLFFYDTALPLNIDLFSGVIKGRLIGINKTTNKHIVADFSSNYKDIFNSMNRVGRYKICNGHKVSKVSVYIGD